MTYDGLERLITASGPWGQGTFSYDSLGNIRTKNLGSRRVTINYDSDLRVLQSIDTGGMGGSTGVRSFDYDNRGNTKIAGALTFTYDYADQPITVTGAQQGVYQYDGNFKRVKNTVGGDTIYNVYTQSGQLAHVHNVSKNERNDYVKLGSLTVARVKNSTPTTSGTPTYLHFDKLGSAVAATKINGEIEWTNRYTPFGISLNQHPSNEDQAGYTGHIEDQDTGLVYMQARLYDPVIGRFYSNDPVGFTGDITTFNRYSYVGNSPFNYTDPNGESRVSECGEGGSTCTTFYPNGKSTETTADSNSKKRNASSVDKLINKLPEPEMSPLPARGDQYSQSGCARNDMYKACVARAQEWLDASGMKTGGKTILGTIVKNTVVDIIKNSPCTTYCGTPPLPGGNHYPLDDVIPPLPAAQELKDVHRLRKSLEKQP